MLFKRKKEIQTPPQGMGIADIQRQSSICTGETVIGFWEPKSGRLLQSVVVRSPKDEADFYRVYGFEPPKKL
nr:hypothetical protein [uncultured Gemmiger sp.]